MLYLRHYLEKLKVVAYINLGISFIYECTESKTKKESLLNISMTDKDHQTINIQLEKINRNNCYFILGNIFKKTVCYYNLHIHTTNEEVEAISRYANTDFVFSKLPKISHDNELIKLYLVNTFIKYLKKRNEREGVSNDPLQK